MEHRCDHRFEMLYQLRLEVRVHVDGGYSAFKSCSVKVSRFTLMLNGSAHLHSLGYSLSATNSKRVPRQLRIDFGA